MSKVDKILEVFDKLNTDKKLNEYFKHTQVGHLREVSENQSSNSSPLFPSPFQDDELKTKLWDYFTKEIDLWPRPFPVPEAYTPKPIVDFVSKISQRIKPSSILDPVCGYGLLLASAAEVTTATVQGVEFVGKTFDVASIVLGEQSTLYGDAFAAHKKGKLGQYDLIVADPPLGMKLSEDQALAINLKTSSFNFEEGLLLMVASRLNPSGVALVVVKPSFFFSSKSKQVQKFIQKEGCRISAAIHIPSGTFQNTAIASYLLMIEQGSQEEIFVGQLSPDPVHQDQLLKNLIRRKPKGGPSLGRICSLSKFLGYEAFVAQENLSRLARECGWKEFAAKEVFSQHEFMREEEENEVFTQDANSLFLKLIGKGRASIQIDELRFGESKSLREILHLKTNPNVTEPNFFVHWVNNSRIGRLTLDTLRGDSFRPRIRVKDFLELKIYLPPVQEQKLFVEGIAYLKKVHAETEELKSALFSGNESTEDLVSRIHSINQEDHYENWLESIPFPMASILWRHFASKDTYRHRYEILIHFFEATAAFLATIHLSAFMSDNENWEECGRKLHEKLMDQKLSLDQATFGTWKIILERLSSTCSSILKDSENQSDKRELWQRIYGSPDREVLKMLSNSEILGLIQQANKLRNDWQGHRGALSEDTAKSVHDRLFDLVQQIRGIFGRNWERYEMIQPGSGRYRQGMYFFTCRRLMGTRSTPFEEQVYQSRHPLEEDALYLFDSVNGTGIQLRPLIEVIPSPEKQAMACFIFSRIEKHTTRWISYHFEQESEIKHSSKGVEETLSMLNRFKGIYA